MNLVTADTVRSDLQEHAPLVNTLILISNNENRDFVQFFKGITIEPYRWIDKNSCFTEQEIYELTYKLYKFNTELIQLLRNLSEVNNSSAFTDINSIIDAMDECIKKGAQFQEEINELHDKVNPDKEREKIGGCVQDGTEEHKKLEYLHITLQLKNVFDRRIDVINKQFPPMIEKLKKHIKIQKSGERYTKKINNKPLKARNKIKKLLEGILKRISGLHKDIYLTYEQVAKMYGYETSGATPDEIKETATHAIYELNKALELVRCPTIGRYDSQKLGWPCPVALKKFKNILSPK